MLDDLQLAVIGDLGERLSAAQVFVFEVLHVVEQRTVGAQAVGIGMFLQQPRACALALQHLLHLRQRLWRVAM
ncbi:MAG: hypothetical protein HYX43_04955 [Burkholderiales bacterium]|nr:hypothetical protein [Burkholderiales bacterium]